jgi:hypothetical protein
MMNQKNVLMKSIKNHGGKQIRTELHKGCALDAERDRLLGTLRMHSAQCAKQKARNKQGGAG